MAAGSPFSASVMVTNKRVGRCCSIFSLIHINKTLFDLSGACLLANGLFINEAWPSLSGEKFSFAVLGGKLYIVNKDVQSMNFSFIVPQGVAFIRLLSIVAADVCRALYIGGINCLDAKFPRIRGRFFETFGNNDNDISRYYRFVAETPWFKDAPEADQYAQIKDLCAYFASRPSLPEKRNRDKANIQNQLSADESYIFFIPLKSVFKREYAIFTDQRLLLADNDFNIKNAYVYSSLTIDFSFTFINLNHNRQKIASIKRDWLLMPEIETLFAITKLPPRQMTAATRSG
jgi:hypothetical protein